MLAHFKQEQERADATANAKMLEKTRELHAHDKIPPVDCSKCKSFSFDNLKFNLRSEWRESSGSLLKIFEYDSSISGTICGNPQDERSSGYLTIYARQDNSKGVQQRIPWKPGAARPSWQYYLDLQPPQIELTVEPGEYVPSEQTPNTITKTIPSEKFTVRVPLTVSEEPLGCESAETQSKPVSSVPQVTKWFTRFAPLPST